MMTNRIVVVVTGLCQMVHGGESPLHTRADGSLVHNVSDYQIPHDCPTDQTTSFVEAFDVGRNSQGHPVRPGDVLKHALPALEDDLHVEAEDKAEGDEDCVGLGIFRDAFEYPVIGITCLQC